MPRALDAAADGVIAGAGATAASQAGVAGTMLTSSALSARYFRFFESGNGDEMFPVLMVISCDI